MKELLLAIADKSITSDAELQRLMQTGFAAAFGPHMRALFPPIVTAAMHLPMHAPEFRAKLSAEEEKAASEPLPAPPHQYLRDHECTVGLTVHTLHQDPRIAPGTCDLCQVCAPFSSCSLMKLRRNLHTRQVTLAATNTGFRTLDRILKTSMKSARFNLQVLLTSSTPFSVQSFMTTGALIQNFRPFGLENLVLHPRSILRIPTATTSSTATKMICTHPILFQALTIPLLLNIPIPVPLPLAPRFQPATHHARKTATPHTGRQRGRLSRPRCKKKSKKTRSLISPS